MNVLPFAHEGLGNSSYLVGVDDANALVVDPDRSFDRYLRAAGERGWDITGVLETHVHADFVTGAVEAIHATGARVFQPAGAACRYPHEPVRGDQPFTFSGAEIQPVASPGHTPEHMSYVLRAGRRPPLLFSGGSLIVGGAARTDLIAPDQTATLTRQQFHTLREAFASLPDETLLYPTHGGGSFCSAGGGTERWSTLGRERAENPALAVEDEEEFVRWFPATFPAAPGYFFRMRAFNQAGPRLRADVARPRPMSPEEFERTARQALIVDVRPKEAYARAHIPGSLSIPFRDAYAVWLGWLVPAEAVLLFVLGDEPVEPIVDESMLVGCERFAGWLEGGLERWEAEGHAVKSAPLISPGEARQLLRDGAYALDVREPDEVQLGAIAEASAVPLGQLQARAGELPKDRPAVVYCGHGDRASTAVSLLERAGFDRLVNLDGGYDAWKEAIA